MAVYAPCPTSCSPGNPNDEIVVGLSTTILVPAMDDDGSPLLDEKGAVVKVAIRLPKHRGDWTLSRLDPTGLAPAACIHGLAEHPDPAVQSHPQLVRFARSWIRAKHLDHEGRCPVDRGQPAPDDLAVPANA